MSSNSRLIVLLALLTALIAIPAHADWAEEALKLQEQLDVDEPFNRTFWVGTHNSYNARQWAWTYEADPNQWYTPYRQMQMGARELTYDIYKINGKLLLCHSLCSSFEKDLDAGLQEIRDFIEDGNEDSVILLKLEVEGNYTSIGEELDNSLGDMIYAPTQGEISISSNPSGCYGLEPEHLTKAQVLEAGKNVVVITTLNNGCPDNDTFESWVHVGLEYDGGTFEEKFSKPKGDTEAEAIEDCGDIYASGEMSRLHDGVTFDVTGTMEVFGDESHNITTSNVEELMACGLNIFELFNYGDQSSNDNPTDHSALEPEDLVWSWAANEPVNSTGEEDCAVLDESTGRFEAQSCSTSHAFACYDAATGAWAVTGSGSFDEAQVACQSFGATYSFTAPTHPAAKFALQDLLTSSEQVWINYHDLQTEGDWVANPDYLYSTVIDNEDPSLISPSSGWIESTAVAGYTGNNYQAASGSTAPYAEFIWTYEVPENGWYQVSARWTSHPNRGTAQYLMVDTIFNTSKYYGDALEDHTVGGGRDRVLGCFFVNTTYLMTYLAPQFGTDGYVVADTITIKRLFDQTSSSDCDATAQDNTTFVIDNGDTDTGNSANGGSFGSGNWPTSGYTLGYEGTDYAFADGSNGIDSYYWSFTPETAGYYDISARWTAHSNRGNAEYELTRDFTASSETFLTTTRDQSVNGGLDNLLWSRVYLEADTDYQVLLSSVTDGRVVADAIIFELVD